MEFYSGMLVSSVMVDVIVNVDFDAFIVRTSFMNESASDKILSNVFNLDILHSKRSLASLCRRKDSTDSFLRGTSYEEKNKKINKT